MTFTLLNVFDSMAEAITKAPPFMRRGKESREMVEALMDTVEYTVEPLVQYLWESSWYIAHCPLNGRCPLFGVSPKIGSTVTSFKSTSDVRAPSNKFKNLLFPRTVFV